jgi:hypothetical protein
MADNQQPIEALPIKTGKGDATTASTLADMLLQSPEEVAKLMALQEQMFQKQQEQLRARASAEVALKASDPFTAWSALSNMADASKAKREEFDLLQQQQLMQIQQAAEAKKKVEANIAAMGGQLGLTPEQIQRAQITGSIETVGKEVKAAAEGNVAARTQDTLVQQANANLAKTAADTAQSKAAAAASLAQAQKATVEAQGTMIDNQRKLQVKEGDWVVEKQPDGSTRKVQLGKLPEGMRYVQNSDGTFSTTYDIGTSEGANKLALENLTTVQQAINKKEKSLGTLTALSRDPAIMTLGEISPLQVSAARGKQSAGMASETDLKIIAYDNAMQDLAVGSMKEMFGANTSNQELAAAISIQGSASSPKLQRDWAVAYGAGLMASQKEQLGITQSLINQGVAPAKAAALAQEKTKFRTSVETLRTLLNAGNSELIRRQADVMNRAGVTLDTVQRGLGQSDFERLMRYVR